MTNLPPGWTIALVSEVAEVQGGIQKQAKRKPISNKYPFLRVANVGRGSLNLGEVHEVELFDGELERFSLQAGDLLVVEGNGSPNEIGRAAMWHGEIESCVHQNHLIRVRPTEAILPRFLELAWNSPNVMTQLREVSSSTSGLHTLSTAKIKSIQLPIPPKAEQQRILATLEEHLSRYEAAIVALNSALERLPILNRSNLYQVRENALREGGQLVPLTEVADTSLGKMLDSKRNEGRATPYLRNVNVRWGSFDLKEIDMVAMPEEQRSKFALQTGDLLVCEGGEPGRCAIWPGSDNLMAYQKAIHRVRPHKHVKVEWLALMIEESVRNGRTAKLLTGTTIKHLPQEKLRALLIPVPAIEAQERLIIEYSETLRGSSRLENALGATAIQSKAMCRSLLTEAFEGRLAPQDPRDEPASVLLERIKAERASVQSPGRQVRRTKAKAKAGGSGGGSGTGSEALRNPFADIPAPSLTTSTGTPVQETLL